MNSVAIHAEQLVVDKNGQRILGPIDMAIAKGRIVGLIGPSGAGKTTLMRTIVGVQSHKGSLIVLGRVAGAKELRSEIGYVTQTPAVYGDITVRQNMVYFAAIMSAHKSQIDDILAQVELAEYADRLVDSLSGGQRARVSLAAALLGSPDLLVLDEPTVGLDPVLRANLWELFRSLADQGVTLFVSSHVMDEAERCDDIVLIRDGAILWNDTRLNLLEYSSSKTVGGAFEKIIRGDAQ